MVDNRVMARPRPSGLAAAVAAVALSGCAFGQPQVAGQTPSMPECAQAGRFAFAGEATLAELDLEQFGGGPEANRRARIWVTADPVPIGGPAPAGFPQPPPERVVCVEWPDGSAMMGPVPRDWQPPSLLETTAEPAGLPPVVPLLLAAVAIAAASYLAFRRAER
jgi:hypothetical protein